MKEYQHVSYRAYRQALSWNSRYAQALAGVARLDKPKGGLFGLFRRKR